MADEEVYVYLPDDEPETQDYNGVPFRLEANASTRIVSPWLSVPAWAIAAHLVEKLGMWGACRVLGPVKDCKPIRGPHESKADFERRESSDQIVVSAAERLYLENTHKWCVTHILEYEKEAKPLREAGLSPPPRSPDVVSALKWEKGYQDKLKDAGLIA
jgi:hypothetical protein